MVALAKEAPSKIPSTDNDALDRKLERLQGKKRVWARVPIKERIRYLDRVLRDMYEAAPEIATQVALSSGFDPDEDAAGEFWLSNSMAILRCIRQLRDSLKAGGQPKLKKWQRPDGQWVCEVYPLNLVEKSMFPMTRIESWIEPGKEPTQGEIYRRPPGDGAVSLILGAGNFASIPACDALHKLFVENEVALVKMNPVNETTGPALELGFRSLIDDGFLDFCYGGAEVGKYLTSHDDVETIHITGAAESHDAIVWGVGAEQTKNKAAGTPVIDKPMTSELGGVGPCIICPGDWSESDLRYHAQTVAFAMTLNTGYACAAAKVIVLPGHWKHTPRFRELLREELAKVPPRPAYYPGTNERFNAMLEEYPQAELLGEEKEGMARIAIIPDVKLDLDEYAMSHESFCTISAESIVDSADDEDFLRRVAQLVNENTYGNLQCTVICKPQTQKKYPKLWDQLIADLEFGCVSVNLWTGAPFALMNGTWGAYAGNKLEDVQSGIGQVHGAAALLDHVQKSVLYATWKLPVHPPLWMNNKNLLGIGKAWARFETKGSLFALTTGLFPQLLKG